MRERLLTAGALCASAVLAGCGTIGDPKFPATYVPNPVTDLTVVERGNNLVAAFTIPPLTIEGLPVKEVGIIDLRVGTGTFDPAEWEKKAQIVPVTPPPTPSVVQAKIPIEGFIGKEVLVGVRVGGPKGRVGVWSNLVGIHVEAPLETPSDLKAETTAQGVMLHWQPGNAASWRIFRVAGEEREPVLVGKSDKPEYLDRTASFGTSYTYFVQTERDRVESEVSTLVTIKPEDKFPPSVPAGLAAISGTSTIELTWQRNTENDFKAYRVYRALGDGPFNLLADELAAPAYSDAKLETGKHYRYTVASVDQTGNVSERCAPVEATAP